MPTPAEELRALLEDLTGQTPPFSSEAVVRAAELLAEGKPGVGYSQLNELLLLLGYDRVSHSFFQYVNTGALEYQPGAAIKSLADFRAGVDRFRKVALLLFGNVKFGFKTLGADAEELKGWIATLEPIDEQTFASRHEPVQPVDPIPGPDTFYLGYIVERELAKRLQGNPKDAEALAGEERRKEIVAVGKRNHEAYLSSDHLDVYVATSMRERHEYIQVNLFSAAIFSHEHLAPLNLRYFDPTQAYCSDRIDKGLSEALMLKRASCTLYFAQESDTLGKDSELASTLAQGKPVIAFIPTVDDAYVAALLETLKETYPDKLEIDIILDQLRVFEPRAAWLDEAVRTWLADPKIVDVETARKRLSQQMQQHYDTRASLLRESHPLGIQVHLARGVANGVLVVRTIESCALLIRKVVTLCLEFDLEEKSLDGREYLLLRERISQCIFRVMTGDALLTNSFWNFYLDPAD